MFSSNYILLTLYATLFTWLLTTLGSSTVFLFKRVNEHILNISLSLASGIMMSASFWSLLNPAIKNAKYLKQVPWLVVSLGFILGGLFIFLTDKYFQKKHSKNKRTFLMMLSITMHNIPEGLAIGIAFGSVKYGIKGISLVSALMLSLAIGIQNFPEGLSISLPLRGENNPRFKSFLYGSLSGIVEPIFGLIGVILAIKINYLMPIFLSFAAGAMIYVIVEELIPESQNNSYKPFMTLTAIIGFTIMMILDIAL